MSETKYEVWAGSGYGWVPAIKVTEPDDYGVVATLWRDKYGKTQWLQRAVVGGIRPVAPRVVLGNGLEIVEGEITKIGKAIFRWSFDGGAWRTIWWNGSGWDHSYAANTSVHHDQAQPSDIPAAIPLADLPPRLKDAVAKMREKQLPEGVTLWNHTSAEYGGGASISVDGEVSGYYELSGQISTIGAASYKIPRVKNLERFDMEALREHRDRIRAERAAAAPHPFSTEEIDAIRAIFREMFATCSN